MKIVRQLANWLLENDRIDPEKYQKVLAAIQGGVGDGEGKMLHLADMRQRDRDAVEDSAEDWWCLRGAGGRAKASRRKGGRKAARDTKPIKVDELDPLLPDMLLPRGATPEAFPLAVLLVAVDKARGNRRTLDWAGFAASAAALYKIGAEELHDAFFAAMKVRGRELGKIIADAEMGSSLFPKGFLSDLSGESVTVLLKRVAGEETEFSADKADWILRYPSFNVINEACLVRNRLRRIYRLWVKNLADWDVSGAANHGRPDICLVFGKTPVHVPAIIWWKMQDPQAPHLGSARGMVVAYTDDDFVNLSLDGAPAVFYDSRCIEPPDPPCQFGWIREDELQERNPSIQILWPIVQLNERVPVLSLPDAPETIWWSPGTWAVTVAYRRELSTGVPAEKMCPWRVLYLYPPVHGWAELYVNRPDLVKDFPWDLIDADYIHIQDWVSILTAHPECAERAPWAKFDFPSLNNLFSSCPELAGRCDCKAIDFRVLTMALEQNPDCAGPCLQNFTNTGLWAKIAEEHPSWLAHCPWHTLSGYVVSDILRTCPEWVDRCDLSRMSGFAWRTLLCSQPQLASYCDWGKLDECDWESLLKSQPQLFVYRPTHA